MLKLALLLSIGTAATYEGCRLVSARYGEHVGDRFLERSPEYSATSLASWVNANRSAASRYAVPVLFPLDLLFMAFLAAFIAVTAVWIAGHADSLVNLTSLFVFLPALYLAADLAEDVILARFLLSPATITTGAVTVAQTLTTIKIWSLSAAGVQLLPLGVLALACRR